MENARPLNVDMFMSEGKLKWGQISYHFYILVGKYHSIVSQSCQTDLILSDVACSLMESWWVRNGI